MVSFGGTRLGKRNVALTIDQGAKDDEALKAQSSDVATGLTTALSPVLTETDDYLLLEKLDGAEGGLRIVGIAEDGGSANRSMQLLGVGGTPDTTKTTAAVGLIDIIAFEHDGANGLVNATADANILTVRARLGGTTLARLLVDEDGDLYSVTTAQTFDAEDDIGLIDKYDRVRSGNGTEAERADLERLKIIAPDGVDEHGEPASGLTNQTQLGRLITGTLRQLSARIDRLEQPPPSQAGGS